MKRSGMLACAFASLACKGTVYPREPNGERRQRGQRRQIGRRTKPRAGRERRARARSGDANTTEGCHHPSAPRRPLAFCVRQSVHACVARSDPVRMPMTRTVRLTQASAAVLSGKRVRPVSAGEAELSILNLLARRPTHELGIRAVAARRSPSHRAAPPILLAHHKRSSSPGHRCRRRRRARAKRRGSADVRAVAHDRFRSPRGRGPEVVRSKSTTQ